MKNTGFSRLVDWFLLIANIAIGILLVFNHNDRLGYLNFVAAVFVVIAMYVKSRADVNSTESSG